MVYNRGMESTDIVKTFLSLNFYGFPENPVNVTEQLGIEPTEAWLEGDAKHHKLGFTKFPRNTWTLKAKVAETAPLNEHLANLLEIITPHKDRIRSLARKYESEFWFVLYADTGNPVIRLSPEIMSELAEFAVPVALDLYASGTEEPK
jgi:glycine cleavage system protein P-like pyridoxal-binding family